MNSWQLALVVVIVCMSLGYYFYDPPADKPVPPQNITLHSPPPERIVIEAP